MKITIKQIRDKNPCYDPGKYLPEDWEGSIIDILQVKEAPVKDRIWVATKLLDDKTNRLFAVDCARRALSKADNPDPRSLKSVDIAEKYAYGKATDDELRAACDAAWNADYSAARNAAWSAKDSNKERELQVKRMIEINFNTIKRY